MAMEYVIYDLYHRQAYDSIQRGEEDKLSYEPLYLNY